MVTSIKKLQNLTYSVDSCGKTLVADVVDEPVSWLSAMQDAINPSTNLVVIKDYN